MNVPAAEAPLGAPSIGIDIGGTKMLGRVVGSPISGESLRLGPVDQVSTPTDVGALCDAVTSMVERLCASGEGIGSIGVGIAGLVDRQGVLQVAPNLEGIQGLDLRRSVRTGGRGLLVENDATCAMWAESRFGAARGASEAVLVTIGTGIGGGIVSGGQLVRGAHGFAGEPGHMVVDPSGPPCPCGRRGCWERFASGSGLGRLARDAARAGLADRVVELAGGDADDVRGEHVSAAALDGDGAALRILKEFAWWMGLGIANLVDLLDPEIVVIGGGLAAVEHLWVEPVRAAYDELVFGQRARHGIEIVPAAFGAEASAVGAALLAMNT